MFRRIIWVMASLFIWCSTAQAVELSYKWKKGSVHRFSYEDESSIQVNTGGMAGIDVRMKVESVFSMKVLRVRPNGTADVELQVHKLDVYQGGKKLATLTKIPPAARKVKAEMDRKGRAKFFRMVSVYIKDEGVYVGIHKAQVGPTGASASASAGGPEGGVTVDVVASVDPATGKVTAAMQVKGRPPALKKIAIREEDPAVDVFPKALFEMLVLPDGSIQPGQTQKITLPFVTMEVTLAKWQKKVATLHTVSKVTAEEKTVTPPVDVDPEDEDEDEASGEGDDMDMDDAPDMGNMPGMKGMPGMEGMPDMGKMMGAGDGLPGGESPMGGVKVDADVTTRFDTGAGKLLGMQGSLGTRVSMGGMGGIQVSSKFVLKRL